VRNTAVICGQSADFDPGRQSEGGSAVPMAELAPARSLMLHRTAELIEEVSAEFRSATSSYRFFQRCQNFCVVDLSNF